MLRLRLALCLLAPLSFAVGCYSERLPPPNFRYTCGSDGDCRSDERCISGLCQVPCTQATAAEDCPVERGFATCLNGTCVSTCELPPCRNEGEDEECDRPQSRSTCSAPQTCIDLGIDVGGGSSSPFSSSGDAAVGVCAQECTEDSCPDGEVCLQGFCVATCDPTGAVTCNEALGLSCQGGFCLPDLGGEDEATTTDTDATDPTIADMTMTGAGPGSGSNTNTGTNTDTNTDTGAPTG